ncbi:PD-(D/E)XK nuclease family protein [Roseiconus lacunae]|uniref:PD-(D/E)XK nuclease family protein n=1 Tax=Roseiconus lacunae TaxID=2605694 RepID=A0ABT7PQK0_9BACT|nr:PD-(D/E)XK nuclease family protein [Roseiconus lacunae]MDM4018778.1 PD-(D/E)XK nuclease family protein [Roseiconus lacunae]
MELFQDLLFQKFFLGWESPLPVTAVDWLVERFGKGDVLDLRSCLCVLPTTQSARQIERRLAHRAGELSLQYSPPITLTAGELPERMYRPEKPIAIEFEQTLAWARTLKKQPDDRLRPLMPTLPEADSLAPWLEIAGTLRRLSSDLASHDVTFEQVLGKVQTAAETRRWELLKSLYEGYLSELSQAGLSDPFEQRRRAIEKKQVRSEKSICLIGTSDLNESIAAMVNEVAGEVFVLVAAPQSREGSFDHLGRLRTDAFLNDELPLNDEQLISCGDISDQAVIAAAIVSDFSQRLDSSQITVGLTDESQLAPVEMELEDRGLPGHRYAGWTVAQTAPGKLIALLARLVTRPTWDSLAAFVRHSDAHRWIQSQLSKGHLSKPDVDFLGDFDRLLADHFPINLADPLPALALKHHRIAVEVRELVCQWIASFLPADFLTTTEAEPPKGLARKNLKKRSGDKQPISKWSRLLLQWLATSYHTIELETLVEGEETSEAEEAANQKNAVRSSEATSATLTEQAAAKVGELLARFAELNGRLDVEETASMALETLNSRLAELRVGIERPANADHNRGDQRKDISLHGWLDLSLDDAPAMVVVGFNHPFVPGAVTSDPFLPGALRSELRMADNDRRYARDVYAMHLMLQSRSDIRFIVGSNAADRSPTPPSRLLSAASADSIARRVRTLLHDRLPTPESDFGSAKPLDATHLPMPSIETDGCPIESMSVTAFKSYLECPFRFYLRHVLGLKPLDDSAGELAANQFGDLVHGALENFGESDDKTLTSSKRIYDALLHHLDDYAVKRYGSNVRSAVQMQIRQAQQRLRFVAEAQAERIDQGWQIHATEASVDPSMGAAIEVDGRKMGLKGRFDRIDYHPDKDCWAILDYKTHGSPPEKKHLRNARDGDDAEWIDLQLPLYREMIPYLGIEVPRDEVQLGYFNVSDKKEETRINLANFTTGQLDVASELIRECIRRIFACDFAPTEDLVQYDDYEMILQTGVPTRMLTQMDLAEDEVNA